MTESGNIDIARDAARSSPVPLAVLDATGALLFANQALHDYCGRPECPRGTAWLAWLHPDDRPRVELEIGRSSAARQPFDVRCRVVTSAGRELPTRVRGGLWTGSADEFFGYSVALTPAAPTSANGAGEDGAAGEQAALRRVATAVATALAEAAPEAGTFQMVTREARMLLDGDAGFVLRFDGNDEVVLGSDGSGPDVGARYPHRGDRAVARVHLTGMPARVDSYETVRTADRKSEQVVPERYGCGVAAPVRAGSQIWGAVLVVRLVGRPAFDGDSESRLAGLADLLGLSIGGAEARRQLAALAATDPLTGLANHRTFQERMRQEVERASRHGHPLSLVMLDLDHFKAINDSRGHAVGDEILAETAARLRSLARAGDTLARLGGEEFGWLLPETRQTDAVAAAERARALMAASRFAGAGQVTLSAGVAELVDGDVRGLYDRADRALYAAKAGGRNAVRHAS